MSEPTKCCTFCKEVLPISRFYRNPSARDGLRTDCKVCSQLNHKPRATKGLNKAYTTRELQYMAANYDRLGPSMVALRLGRSMNSVKSKRWSMQREAV